MSMKSPSLSFLITFGGKLILFDIRMTSLFLGTICLKNCFLAFYSEVVSVFVIGGFVLCSKMLDPVYLCSVLDCVFLLGNPVH